MIYLDNAATSFPKAPKVSEAVFECLNSVAGSAGRSSHKMARQSDHILFSARCETSELLGIKNPERLIFTKNANESLNLAILGSLKEGDVVATTSLEHNSVMRPLRYLEKTKNIKILILKCDENSSFQQSDLAEIIKQKPKMMVLNAVSNVTGSVLDFAKIIKECQQNNILVGLDASQMVGHIPINFDETGADFIAFSAHKGLLAPSGIGGLYLSQKFNPEPLIFGGTGSLSDKEYQPENLPDKYESGTPNIAVFAGLIESAKFIKNETLKKMSEKEESLTKKLLNGLLEIPKIEVFGHNKEKKYAPVISILVDGFSISDITYLLDKKDIAVRMGLHCSPLAHKSIGTFDAGGTIRFSPSYFTKEDEIDEVLAILKDIIK